MGDLGNGEPEGFAELRADFPLWQFGTLWPSVDSGDGRRRAMAYRGTLIVSAWTVDDLRRQVAWEDGRLARDAGRYRGHGAGAASFPSAGNGT